MMRFDFQHPGFMAVVNFNTFEHFCEIYVNISHRSPHGHTILSTEILQGSLFSHFSHHKKCQ